MKRVTLADVARHSGVSKMTVSCVVRGIQCVKEETRKRVQDSIALLGYRVDPMLRSLASYRSRTSTQKSSGYRATLAYLDCDCDAFTLSMLEKAAEEAAQLGYQLKHFELPREEAEQRRMSRRLWLQGIRGLLFSSSQEELSIQGFQAQLFAMVSIGAHHHFPAIDAVGADYFQSLYLAATQCYKQGARRIGLVVPNHLDTRTGHRWVGAYNAFCLHHGLQPLQLLVSHWPISRFVSWVKRERVDALLGLQGIRVFENRLPGVFFASLNDWQPVADGGHIHIPQELIAREAIGLLDYNLLRQRYGIPQWPRHIAIEGKWREHLVKAEE